MKRILNLLVAVVILCTIFLASCGNMSVGPGNFSFSKVHIDTYHYSGCLDIKKWYDNGTGIEVKTEDEEGIFLSEGTYILVEDNCPFCGDE